MRSSLRTLLLVFLGAACGQDPEPAGAPGTVDAAAAMRRGVGLLEAFRYAEARSVLRTAVEAAPDWTDAKVNYAIALMNLTSDEESGEDLAAIAIDLMRDVVAAEPDNPNARFMLGFLLLHSHGESEQALEHLTRVSDPDSATLCWIGRAELDLGHLEAALKAYEQAALLDRHVAAALYGQFVCLTRLGRKDEARKKKEHWQRLRTPQEANLLTANAYHEIGLYALAIRRYPGSRPKRREFEWDSVPLDTTALSGASVALGDIDGDGDLDAYLPGALLENDGKGAFRKRGEFPHAAGLFFDFDGDQVLDLFLYGERDRLYRGAGDGSFTEVSALPPDPRRSRFALCADLDMDGDVDLFVTEDGAPDRVLRNNRDGTFTESALGNSDPSRGAIVFDYDRDQDPDLLVAREGAPPLRFRNDRADGFVPAGPASLPRGTALVAGDFDRDGYEEVRAIDHPLLLVDVDLDGAIDEVALPDMRSAAAADLDGDGTPEVLAIAKDGTAVVRKARVKAGHWIAFDLRGRTAPSPPQWAAPVGPGSRVEVLAGDLWQLQVSRSVSGFSGQHSPWITFGLGERRRVDIVRILWPDRVLQAELDLPVNQLKVIREANRKPSSCPLLFADGKSGPRYVTDFLGSGGLGFFLEPGVYGKPDPDEVVAIGPLEPIDGHYVLRILEPLEEVSYLDEATLLVVEHPLAIEVLANERFACEEPFPEFRFWEIESRVAPQKAWNDRGDDVTQRVMEVDRRYPPVVLDKRFEGFAREHWLALDFTGRVPATTEGEHLILILDGWVEYGYSHSNFAAAQAGVALAPPVLEVRVGDVWQKAIANTGYPAGLPRTMTLDVTGVVTPQHPVFRLRTNLDVYWDRVTLGLDRGQRRARVHRVLPERAHLHERGYPREYSPDGAIPVLYDYGLMDQGYPFKTMSGDYTRFGEVAPLLQEADDCSVIFGKGEELVLRYPQAALPMPEDGTKRTFFLYAVGFCKDMDPYTAHPYTIEPLPFRAMSNYPYGADERFPDDEKRRRYRTEWNTRRVSER